MAFQRRRAAAIYRDGQRRVLQEAIQELEDLLDQEGATGEEAQIEPVAAATTAEDCK